MTSLWPLPSLLLCVFSPPNSGWSEEKALARLHVSLNLVHQFTSSVTVGQFLNLSGDCVGMSGA